MAYTQVGSKKGSLLAAAGFFQVYTRARNETDTLVFNMSRTKIEFVQHERFNYAVYC